MPNDYFRFKQFIVYQDKCAMKVGTDAVLLGAWIQCSLAKYILDVGTGTGVIALMLAQKSKALIDAIDIDESAYQQARENIVLSKWKNRIKVYPYSFQKFVQSTQKKYDFIVSNPPYFSNSYKSDKGDRNNARHTDHLSFNDLIEGTLHILAPAGKLCLILPQQEGFLFSKMAEEKFIFLTRLTRVKTQHNKQEKRLLMQFEYKRKNLTEDEIILETGKRHSYSPDYIALTKDYYLNF